MKTFRKFLLAIVALLACTIPAAAQSSDPGAPAPIRRSNLQGKIIARDLGDARLTDHYYAFTGTPGDLIITVQTHNLNGDLDVFTAVTLQPLLKLPLYAESVTPVTKGIYLRKRQDLILRIEARTPNDDPGTYQLYFGGSFEPVLGGPDIEETEAPPAAATLGDKKTKRVSSVGARIEDNTPGTVEVTTAPTADAPSATAPIDSAPPSLAEKPAVTEPAPKPVTPPISARTTNAKPARTTGRRTPATATPKETVPASTEPAETATNKPVETVPTTGAKPAKAPTRNTARKSAASSRSTSATPSESASAPAPKPAEPEVGPRLIIETNDGTMINRSMSTVRRVLVENGQVVVVGKDGKIDRMLLLHVTKMEIQP